MTRRRFLPRALALILASALLAAACGDDGGSDEASPDGGSSGGDVAGEPQSGGALRVLHSYETRGLDPLDFSAGVAATSEGPQSSAIYDTLVYGTPEEEEVQMRIAESLDTEDGVTWTLKIRPDVMFSDGTPYDAEAVRMNWERHADEESASAAAGTAQSIVSMEAVDDLTLEITLDELNGVFDWSVANSPMTFIGSPTAIEEKGDGFSDAPVGAGPFTVREWVRDSRLVLDRNPDYWDAPRPYLEELTFQIVPDAQQRFSSFQAGQAEVVTNVTPDQAELARGEGAEVYEEQPGGGVLINFNVNSAPFNDVRARQALAHALDYERHADVVQVGAARALTSIFPESSPFFDAELTLPAHDPELAQDLLDELFEETGEALQFTLIAAASFQQSMEFFQAQLDDYEHISMEIDIIAPEEIVPRQRTGEFQVATYGIPGVLDPEPVVAGHFMTDGQQNLMGYSNPEVDDALERGRTALDLEDRIAAYADAQRLIYEDVPDIWFQSRNIALQVSAEDVRGFSTFGIAGVPQWWDVWLEV